MNNKLSVMVALGLFFLITNTTNMSVVKSYEDSYWYNPEDIALKDNVYNVTDYFSLQWWYVDAVFDNN